MIVEHCCGANAENAESGLGYAAVEGSAHQNIRLCLRILAILEADLMGGREGKRKQSSEEEKKNPLPFVTLEHLEPGRTPKGGGK